MDKAILKKFAIESRQDLMEKIKNKINTFYVDEEFKNEQKGELYILSNEKHSLSLTHEEYKKRELLIKRIKELSLEQVIEEAAYTWFNRIIAIRYMEINEMLPLTKDNQSLGIRVLSSKDNTPDPEILKFTNLMNPELDIDFKKEKYAELKDDNEKFKYVLLLVCKKLGRVIPQVFDGVTDYIDILIPDNLLNDTGFVAKVINEVPESNYNQVEIIGWLYQYYNTENNNLVYDGNLSKKKVPKNLIPAATQIFTPNWVVKYLVENTLVIKLKGINKDFNIDKYKYVISNDISEDEKYNIEDIKFLDPCCGSGHILVYAFKVFYDFYIQAGYYKDEIPTIILNNNLYGFEIDERAAQLSTLALLMKARNYDKNLFNKNINHNIIDIIECSDKLNLDYLSVETKSDVLKLIELYKNAKDIGSLLKIEKNNYDNILYELEKEDNIFSMSISNILKPLIHQSKLLSNKYDVIVTNPPYLNSSRFNTVLLNYTNKEFEMSKADLSMCILENSIKRFSKKDTKLGFITTTSWMYLKNFDKIRKFLLENISFTSLVDFGTELFEGKVGHNPIVAWTMTNNLKKNDFCAIKLSEYCYSKRNEKEQQFFNKSNYYKINQNDILKISGYPMAYWVSHKMIENIEKGFSIDEISDFTGAQHKTANNDKYLRNIWEIEKDKCGKNKRWIFYAKGGEYRKYYGNIEYVVDWSDEACNFYKNNPTSNLIDQKYWYEEGITFTKITSKGSSFRYLEPNGVFDMGGPSIIRVQNLYYCLGLLNCKIADNYFKMVNPTINLQNKDVKSFPIIMPSTKEKIESIETIVKQNVEISKLDWNSFETSWNFKKHPLLEFVDSMPGLHDSNVKVPPTHLKIVKNNYGEDCFIADEIPMKAKISDSFRRWKEYTEKQFNTLKKNEEKLNEIFIDIYGLQDELTPEEEDKDVTIRKADQEREIKSLISYAVGCMFGRYSLDKDGLIYAGGDFDKVYKKYKRENGGWAGAILSNYTVLNDNGKEIELSFEVDNDNVIPITDEAYFGDDIVERFKKFISVAYGKETLNENLDFIAETLGKKGTETGEDTIRRYLVNDFFNDHVKIYQKRPIYWLFDSGKKNGFKALIYMHRYNENLVPKIRLDYLHRMQTTYETLLSDINYKLTTELSMTDKKEVQKRQADLNAKLQEIKEYDEKIAHIANQRISIDLDDGVKVNYEKFKDILAKIK